ncbi:MAG: M23 family metallopeptidase [Actinobacteria bacterium]|nr:M23 family metallopeptidase [Actinomycetota bacterium]
MRRLPALRIAAFAAVIATGLAAVNAAARSPTLDAQPVRSEEASRAPVPLPDSVARGGGLSARLGEGDRSVVPASPLAPQPLVSPKLIERPEVTPPAVAPTPDTVTTTPAPPAKGPTGLPLKVTPPLKGGPYVFPVTGGNVIFGDTYGAFRTDVPGGWHHGDDIFAPLGTPVVAVAKGTVNRVGWQRLGGWRLWVRDDVGDEFYYAHLSGYTPFGLKDKRVHAGEVLGYVGNTGDAAGGPTHLHLEIHPGGGAGVPPYPTVAFAC